MVEAGRASSLRRLAWPLRAGRR